MSDFIDDGGDMTPLSPDAQDDAHIEALLAGTVREENPELARLLLQTRAIAHGSAPVPSPALAALLGGAPRSVPAPARHWGRRLATVTVLSFGTSAMVVGAAAANVLPRQAQHAVARVVNDVTTLHLPGAPTDSQPRPTTPTAAPAHPTAAPAHPATAPTPAVTAPPQVPAGSPSVAPPPATHPPVTATSPGVPSPRAKVDPPAGAAPTTPAPDGGGHKPPSAGHKDDGAKRGRPTPRPTHGHRTGAQSGDDTTKGKHRGNGTSGSDHKPGGHGGGHRKGDGGDKGGKASKASNKPTRHG